ncbi:MAG: aryl-sulfate sulfotransferase [Candidatus Hodarchaeota archaeon]
MKISRKKSLSRYIELLIISLAIIHLVIMRNPISGISGNMTDAREELKDVLSITHLNPTKALEGLTIFTIWRLYMHAPEIHLIDSMIVIVDMEGNIKHFLKFPDLEEPDLGSLAMDPEFIDSTTFVYMRIPTNLVLYNIQTDQSEILSVPPGHHDVEYNPISDTFLTVHFTQYGEYLDKSLLFDDIYEYDRNGNEVWFWNSSVHIPFNHTLFTREVFYDTYQWTHANTIFWDIEENAIYYNARHLDTFYKIDYPSGEILWAAGKLGNLKMFDRHGNERQSLFYHAHAVEVIGPNSFILHDNDYFNTTRDNPQEALGIPRMLEVIVDEETMTMNETWSWLAPSEYFGDVWGDADRLPNGNRLGTFGVPTHPAYLTEVDSQGEIVWELTLEQEKWNYLGIYNADRFLEAPLIEINQTTTEINWANPEGDFVLQVKAWDTFDTRISRMGSCTLTEGKEIVESIDFEFCPHWQESIIYVNISSTGNKGRTLKLTITNEDGLSTSRFIIIGGGATTEPVIGWYSIPMSLGLICYTLKKKKRKKYPL